MSAAAVAALLCVPFGVVPIVVAVLIGRLSRESSCPVGCCDEVRAADERAAAAVLEEENVENEHETTAVGARAARSEREAILAWLSASLLALPQVALVERRTLARAIEAIKKGEHHA